MEAKEAGQRGRSTGGSQMDAQRAGKAAGRIAGVILGTLPLIYPYVPLYTLMYPAALLRCYPFFLRGADGKISFDPGFHLRKDIRPETGSSWKNWTNCRSSNGQMSPDKWK
jgi:hypothetical protein